MRVSEYFLSLQGEGPTSGYPALFIRFSKCNLLCKGSWVCDTQEVMKHVIDVELEEMLKENPGRIVFTGGEPMLYQKEILEIINHELCENTVFEIETNGTRIPCKELLDNNRVQFNVSPKLSGSGMNLERRRKEDVLKVFVERKFSIFKFVISSEEELEEIKRDFGCVWDGKRRCVWLMPAGETREKLEITAPMVARLSIINGVKFSNRLQIILWNTKKGV